MTALDHTASTGQITITVDVTAGQVVLAGEFDRGSAHHLLDALGTLVPTPHDRWELDAAAVTYCDAGGLRALAEAVEFARRLDRRVSISRASRCVWRLLVLTGLDLALAAPAGPVVRNGAQRTAAAPAAVHS